MTQTVIRTKPVNLTGLWKLKVLLPETRELLDIMGELRRTGNLDSHFKMVKDQIRVTILRNSKSQ